MIAKTFSQRGFIPVWVLVVVAVGSLATGLGIGVLVSGTGKSLINGLVIILLANIVFANIGGVIKEIRGNEDRKNEGSTGGDSDEE